MPMTAIPSSWSSFTASTKAPDCRTRSRGPSRWYARGAMPAHEIVDQYPMTPLQQGMLFHRVHGGYAGVDIEQMVGTLRESVDFEAFRRAWDVVAAENPILRTRFAWEGLERPRQEVMRTVVTPYALHDLRPFPPGQQDARIAAYLREDRGRGFGLGAAPLWRVAMFRLKDDEQRVVWTFSHLLLDGCV